MMGKKDNGGEVLAAKVVLLPKPDDHILWR